MLNKILLIGNLGKDPEMTYTEAGVAVTKFSLAVHHRYKDQAGERREETT
jgi:single-strand DNA-binding protein